VADQIKVEGAARLRRTLRQAGADLQDLKDAHQRAAQIAADAARRLAPIGPTGRTAGQVRPGATKTAAIIRSGKKALPYVGRVHWGDPPQGITDRLGRHHKPIRAHTYLPDGARQSEPRWQAVYMQALDKAIQQIEGI